MPWHTRKMLYLILIGAAVVALAIIVFVKHESTGSELLAVIGLLGGIAIIINSLPDNGKNGDE